MPDGSSLDYWQKKTATLNWNWLLVKGLARLPPYHHPMNVAWLRQSQDLRVQPFDCLLEVQRVGTCTGNKVREGLLVLGFGLVLF